MKEKRNPLDLAGITITAALCVYLGYTFAARKTEANVATALRVQAESFDAKILAARRSALGTPTAYDSLEPGDYNTIKLLEDGSAVLKKLTPHGECVLYVSRVPEERHRRGVIRIPPKDHPAWAFNQIDQHP